MTHPSFVSLLRHRHPLSAEEQNQIADYIEELEAMRKQWPQRLPQAMQQGVCRSCHGTGRVRHPDNRNEKAPCPNCTEPT